MTQPTRATAEGRAYRDLQNMARRDRRPFEELLILYTLEGFLTRLARSAHTNTLVLKGGLLLAGYDARRPTRDADFAGRQLTNQVPEVTALVRDIAQTTVDDGLLFAVDSARGETIRDEDHYSGVRVHLDCRLATARTLLKVDVNIGDPITPAPQPVRIPRLLDVAESIDLLGYPLPMVHAEKLVTALQRGTVNTRWRDFADIYLLSHHQSVAANDLSAALTAVATHRGTELTPLVDALADYARTPGVQAKWAAWRRKQQLEDRLPEQFAHVLIDVFAFVDPVITGSAADRTWRPDDLTWLPPESA